MTRWLNISARRVGGLRFLRIGRLQISFCICRAYRDITPKSERFRYSTDRVLVLGFTDE